MPSSTSFSFQPRLSTSCTPVLAPRAPKGDTWCAASPGEEHAAVAEVVDAPAGELVHRHPFQLEGQLRPQHRLDARDDALGLLLGLGVGIPAELEIDAPDIVALLVQQHALAAVEGRVEPEPALGLAPRRCAPCALRRLHHHVGDQEAVLEELAGELRADHRAACRCWRRRRRSPSRPADRSGRRAFPPSAARRSSCCRRPPACASSAESISGCASQASTSVSSR